MQGTIENYVLDMVDSQKKTPLNVKQGDTNSRWARITLKAFGDPWLIPDDCLAFINVKKTDNTIVQDDCTIEGPNVVLAPISEQVATIAGIQLAELYFLAEDGDIKSQTFPIQVLPMIMDQGIIESSNEFGALQGALLDVKTATAAAQGATAEAKLQAGEAREAAGIAMDAAASLDVAVQAAAAAKTSETNAKASETAAAQSKADVEVMKAAFAGYDKTESGRKYANSLTTTAEGDGQVVVTDAWEAPVVNLEVDGASEQVVTKGAQLLDFDAWRQMTRVINGTGVLGNGRVTLTAGSNGDAYTNYSKDTLKIPVKKNTTYTLSWEHSGAEGKVCVFRNGKDDGVKMALNSAKKLEIGTVDEDFLTFRVGVQAPNATASYWNIMLNEGSTALPWEPYTGGKPSPSPEYPQEIVSVAHVANSGSQLFDASRIPTKTAGGVTVTNNGDGSFTITGSGTISANYDNTLKLSASEASELFDKPGDYTFSGGMSTPYVALKIDKSGENIVNVALSTTSDKTFTLTQDAIDTIKDGSATVRIGFYALADKVITPGTIRPMLNAGATPIPWEPYNGQQREIDLQIESTGKNLFNKNALYSYNVNGVTITQLSSTSVRISTVLARTFAAAAVKLKLKPYTTYTFSGDITALTTKSMIGVRKSTDGGVSFVPEMIVAFATEAPAKGVSRTFTTDENEYYALCLCCTNDVEATGTTTFENIQLEEGNKATAWEPYAGYQKVTIPITEPLRGIGDVKDRFCMRDGVWGIERRFDVQIFDGSSDEAWVAVLNNDGVNYRNGTSFIKPKSKANGAVLCTAFTKKDGVTNSLPGFKIAGDASIITYSEAYNTSDVSLWTAYLAENPMTIVYELAMPTWEPFPEDIQADLNALATHPGTTYLTVTSTDVAAPMRLTYVQDTRKVIDSLKLDMAEQMIELQAQIDQLKVTNNLS